MVYLQILFNSILPILIGSIIYIGWRSTNLNIFQWLDHFGLLSQTVIFRAQINSLGIQLPKVILYSFPDGLWVYALTSYFIIIWKKINIWTFVGISIAFFSELGQLIGFFPGTYSNMDVLFYMFSFILSMQLNNNTQGRHK